MSTVGDLVVLIGPACVPLSELCTAWVGPDEEQVWMLLRTEPVGCWVPLKTIPAQSLPGEPITWADPTYLVCGVGEPSGETKDGEPWWDPEDMVAIGPSGEEPCSGCGHDPVWGTCVACNELTKKY